MHYTPASPRGIRARILPGRWAILAIALLLLLALWAVPTGAAADGHTATIELQRGSNEVIYRGPALPAQMIAAQIPHLTAIHRWNATTQRHESITPELPTASAGWVAQPGDVLWVSVRAPGTWEMLVVGDPSGKTLSAGWNVLAWPDAGPTPRKLLDPLEARLLGVWVPDLETGDLRLYIPDQPDSASALHSLRTDSIVWMLIDAGPDVDLAYRVAGTGLSDAALPSAAASLETAYDSLEVQRAVVHVQTVTKAGAGFIIESGEILTAAHVVGLATQVTVRFFDGSTSTGTVAARDERLDVALIRVDEMASDVRRLEWRQETQPQLTQGIWAWGFPYEASLLQAGFSVSVSVVRGIVSAIRISDGVSYLQTDAALNPGNSGGPVTLVDGRLVGMATNTFSVGGADVEGIQFAVDLTQHQIEIETLRAAR